MKTNDKYKPQKERNEFSPFFKKIKECKRARINSIGKSQCTSKMTDSERFENMIHNFNKRTIIYNKLTEAIHVGLTLFTQKEACYLLEIKKTQYEKIISFPMFPMIRIGETIKEDFAKYEKAQKYSDEILFYQIYYKLKNILIKLKEHRSHNHEITNPK